MGMTIVWAGEGQDPRVRFDSLKTGDLFTAVSGYVYLRLPTGATWNAETEELKPIGTFSASALVTPLEGELHVRRK